MKYIFIAIAFIAIACSCSDNAKKIEAAQKLGEQHAIEILNNELSGKALISRLLEIRAFEHELRQEGNNQAADVYISSFTSFIATNNDSLASLILPSEVHREQ